MDLLLLSSPPWHLVKTPLPPSCHCYVPLWGCVSLTLLRVKVWRTREKAGITSSQCLLFFQKLGDRIRRFFFPQVILIFIIFFFPSVFFARNQSLKLHQCPFGNISISCSIFVNPTWTRDAVLRMRLTTLFEVLSLSVMETLSIASFFAFQACESFIKVSGITSVGKKYWNQSFNGAYQIF